MKFWLSEPYNIDVWRIDVANMLARQDKTQLHYEVWEQIRQEIKKTKPEAYLMGEHFFDGTNLLNGNMLDAVMNYQGFTFALLKWLNKKELIYFSTANGVEKKFRKINFSVRDFKQQLCEFRNLIPFQIQLLNFNLLSSHDIPRFLTCLENVSLYNLAIVFLFTYIGVPCIYYGDEIGMEGGFDPDNRRPMIWNEEKWNRNILEFYKKMINLRNTRIELKYGIFKEILDGEEIFAYARLQGSSFTIIILNNNPERKRIELPVWKIGIIDKTVQNYNNNETFSIKGGILTIEIKNYESIILHN